MVLEENEVTLGIEPLNRFETYFLNAAADAAKLAEEVDHRRVGILFDTFHANIEEKDVPAGIERVGKRIVHVRTCGDARGIPGTGHVAWPRGVQRPSQYRVFRMVDNRKLWFCAWGPQRRRGDAGATWRKHSPDAIAFEGIKFLRENRW